MSTKEENPTSRLGLKFVILDCPRDTWNEPSTRALFEQIVSLKYLGYEQLYDRRWNPVDGSDFWATHVMLCREAPQGLQVLATYKSQSLQRCRYFHEPFPPEAIVRTLGSEITRQRLGALLEGIKSSGQDITYGGSWVRHPELKNTPDLTKIARDALTAAAIHYHWTESIPRWLTFGTPYVKTDQHFETMGLARFSETMHYPHYGQDIVLMLAKNYSKDTLEIAEAYRALWESRLVFSKPDLLALERAA